MDADEHCLTFAAFEIWNRSLLDSCVEIENKGCCFPVQESRSGIGLIDVIYTAWLSAAPSGSGSLGIVGPLVQGVLLNNAYDVLVVL